jgi:hypothetical protein
MTEAEHHQQQLERQEMIFELAYELNCAILLSAALPIQTVTEVENGTFVVEAFNRKFQVSAKEI